MNKTTLFLLNILALMYATSVYAQRVVPILFTVDEPENSQIVPHQGQFALSLTITNASSTESLLAGDTILYVFTGATNLQGIVLNITIPPGQSFSFDTLATFTNTNNAFNDVNRTFCVRVLGTANGILNGSWSNPNYLTEICSNIILQGSGGNPPPCSNTFSDINTSACNHYTSPSGNYTWNTSGVYTDTLPNAGGCDSIITIHLTIEDLDIMVLEGESTLTAVATGAVYQWVDCNNNYTPVGGATAQSFSPPTSGSYAVILTEGLCSDTSACYEIVLSPSSVEDLGAGDLIDLYPNPSSGNLTLNTNIGGPKQISIMNLTGKVVWRDATQQSMVAIDVSKQPVGIYMVKIQTAAGITAKRIVLFR